MSDIYGKANYATLHNVPNLKWENINPINDYIATALAQAQLDTEKARVEAFKENMALDRDKFEHTKSNDALLNAMKEKELALNTRKEDREDYQFNNLSAKDKAALETAAADRANALKTAMITASARSSDGNGNGNIQNNPTLEALNLLGWGNDENWRFAKNYKNYFKNRNITQEQLKAMLPIDKYIEIEAALIASGYNPKGN